MEVKANKLMKNSRITSFFTSTSTSTKLDSSDSSSIMLIDDQIHQTHSNQITTPSIKDHEDKLRFRSIFKPKNPKKQESKSNSTLIRFSERELIRTSKQIPIEASWPTNSDSSSHNRSSYQSYQTHHSLVLPIHHPFKFKKPKPKPNNRFSETLLLDEIHQSEQFTSQMSIPRLERFDLVEPIRLLSDLKTNPVYQTGLVSRLLNLLKPLPNQSSITFDHPSLLRQHHRSPTSSSVLWTQKYAPKSSLEVLGEQNLKNVNILKAWLKELALKEADPQDPSVPQPSKTNHRKKSKRSSNHSNKTDSQKRTITRKVDRKSKRRRMNDDDMKEFIVDSDVEESDTIYARDVDLEEEESEEELSFNESPRKRMGSIEFRSTSSIRTDPNTQEKIKIEFENLTNLMLLTGPTGIGKTCSVYALANEIGWDVFELNPGVLRNRKEIERLVGDVARNHVLPNSSNHQPIQSKSTTTTIKKKVENPKGKLGNLFSEMMKGEKCKKDGPIENQGKDFKQLMVEEIQINSNQSSTKQTLILLEEVDIVYQQDKEFWLGVIQLISQSMRPVIMTCNDPNVLPIESLPFQDILEFVSPSIEEVSTLMKVICLNEGHLIDHQTLENFYSFEHQYKKPIEMGIEESEGKGMDLRRCLNMLQFWCQWGIGCKMGGVSWLDLEIDKESKMLFSSDSLPIQRIEQDSNEMSVEEHIKEIQSKKDDEGLKGLWDQMDSFEKIVNGLEIRSFVDGLIDKREKVQIQNFEWDLSFCETDEILLPNQMKWLEKDEFNEMSYKESLASDHSQRKNAIEIRKRLIGILNIFDERKFQIERKTHANLIEISTEFLPLFAPLNLTKGLILDYVPWLRLMIRFEDEAEESYKKPSESETKLKSNRTTREINSGIRTRMSYRLNAGLLPFKRKILIDEFYADRIRKSGIGF